MRKSVLAVLAAVLAPAPAIAADQGEVVWVDPSCNHFIAKIGEEFGYDEINLNIGCPSDRVQDGRFGACLMREPELVGDCVTAMKAAVSVPVTDAKASKELTSSA